jgi:hypothetical protein
MGSEDALWRSVPPGADVAGVWALLHGKVLARSEVYDPCHEGIFIDHNIIRFEVPMENTQLLVEILHALKDLPHEDLDLSLLIQLDHALLAPLLNVLGQAHVHLLKHDVELSVLKLDSLSLHYEGAVTPLLVQFSEPLQNLNFSLIKGLLLGLVLVLEFLDGINLPRFDVLAPVDMAEGATSYEV